MRIARAGLVLRIQASPNQIEITLGCNFCFACFWKISLHLTSPFPGIIMFGVFRCAFWSRRREWLAANTMLGLCHSAAKEVEGRIKRIPVRSKITHHLSSWCIGRFPLKTHKGRIKIMLWRYEGGLLSSCHVHYCIGWDEFKSHVSDWWIGKGMVAL